jgi:hypothetical protein
MSRFLMTPAQHRRQADLLRQAGKHELARQHEILAKLIEHRESTDAGKGAPAAPDSDMLTPSEIERPRRKSKENCDFAAAEFRRRDLARPEPGDRGATPVEPRDSGYDPDMLTPSEIERLRRKKVEWSAMADVELNADRLRRMMKGLYDYFDKCALGRRLQ